MSNDHILQQGLGTVAEEWAKHRRFEHSSTSHRGGTCECGKEMAWEDHRTHQKQEMAMAVAAWAKLTPMGTDDAVRHAIFAERVRLGFCGECGREDPGGHTCRS